MSSMFDSTDRFRRPADIARLRRNQRQIQMQRVLVWSGNLLLALVAVSSAVWLVRIIESSSRFAIRRVDVVGAVHAPRAQLDALTGAYIGSNLFRIDISQVRRDLASISWINSASIEKNVPDLLRIRVTERVPVAIAEDEGCVAGRSTDARRPCALRYVDASGLAFAELSPAVGDDDLPLIRATWPADVARCVALLTSLKNERPDIFRRISELRPLGHGGFAVFDQALACQVYIDPEHIEERWTTFDRIAAAEGFGRGSIAYADLRFEGRVVIRPVHPTALAVAHPVVLPSAITN
jgi:POTRA domain, FtsQ-type